MKAHIFSVPIIKRRGYFLSALLTAVFILSVETIADQKFPVIQKKKDSKVSSLITSTINKMKSLDMTKENAKESHPSSLSNPLVKVDSAGNIQAYIYVQDANQGNISKLQSMEVKTEIVNTKHNVIQGWIPFDKVEEAASLDFIKKITPPSYGKLSAGSVTSEGDSVIRSNIERSNIGFDGSGIRVGVISDGIDHISASQATGDIPNNVIVGDAGSGDEGIALLEIVHDIAPGAELAFSEGFSTSMAFIKSIDFLVNNAKVDVIVSDIEFLDEPYFEDGMIAQEAENAVAQGVVFISSAGNDADQHYQAVYIDQNPGDDQNNVNPHDFGVAAGGGSNILMPVSVDPNSFIAVFLQWNDPFGGSSNDYDLFLLDAQGNPIPNCSLCAGTDIQNGSQDPIESVMFQNNTSNPVRVNVMINRVSGSPRTLEMYFNGRIVVEDFNVPSDSVFGLAAARDVIAAGAVPANDNQRCSSASNPNEIEDFSSLGPSTIFFPSFEQRLKPDVVAPDGVHITGAGDLGSIFCGTSASAPHVAGAAALMLESNPGITPDQVRSALENTAVDLGPSGADDIFGFGRVDALAAVQSVAGGATKPPATQPPSNSGESSNGGGGGGCAIGGQTGLGQGVFPNLLIILIPAAMLGLRRLANKT